MAGYVVVSAAGGLLFGILDGIINANPIAQRLNEVFKPIAKKSINLPAGIVIDLVYGFIMAGIFLLLYTALPGETGLVKGLAFGLLTWFFRVVMSVASQWMMFKIPTRTLLYNLAAGLVEMLALGAMYGLTLKPVA